MNLRNNTNASGTATDYLMLTTGSATTVDVHVSYADLGEKMPRGQGGTVNTAITTATDTVICARPEPYVTRCIKYVSIRNKDSSSNTVTVKIAGVNASSVAVTSEIYKVTLAAGDVLMYDEDVGWHVASSASVGVVNTVISTTTTVNSANNILADVTGLTFAVVAGATYQIRAVVPYTSAATTTGSRWCLLGPAITGLNGRSRYTLDATSVTTNNFTAYGIPAAANASSLTVGNLAEIDAVLTPSAAGTLSVQFASEVDTSAITALAGATLTVTRVA